MFITLCIVSFLFCSSTATQPIATISIDSISLCVDPYMTNNRYSYFQITAYLNNQFGRSPVAEQSWCKDSKSSYKRYDYGMSTSEISQANSQLKITSLDETYAVVSLSVAISNYVNYQCQITKRKAKFQTYIFDLADAPYPSHTDHVEKLILQHEITNGSFYGTDEDLSCKAGINITVYVTCDNAPCQQLYRTTTIPTTTTETTPENNDSSSTIVIAVSVLLVLSLIIISLMLFCIIRLMKQMIGLQHGTTTNGTEMTGQQSWYANPTMTGSNAA